MKGHGQCVALRSTTSFRTFLFVQRISLTLDFWCVGIDSKERERERENIDTFRIRSSSTTLYCDSIFTIYILCVEKEREIVDAKTLESPPERFSGREREREMSMREKEDDEGGDESCVKIDGAAKKINKWKSLKEMKEYLQARHEKKVKQCYRNGGQTYLHFAAYLGAVDATNMLIEDNAKVNAVDHLQCTALHWAAEKGHVDVAKVLIQNGVDVNAIDKDDRTDFTGQLGEDMLTL